MPHAPGAPIRVLVGLAVGLLAPLTLTAADSPDLWSIGRVDRDTREFALAPDGYARYQADSCFVVGQSDAAKDWSYVLPGPKDSWAGKREHAGCVFFTLDAVASHGDCRLLIDLVESHYADPPLLGVRINGHASEYQLPKGQGDGAIQGQPAEGRPYQVVVPVPVSQLQPGINRIELVNQGGSYLVFDAIRMQAPLGTRLGHADGVSFTALSEATAIRGLIDKDGRTWQPIDITLRHVGATADALLRFGDVTGKVHVTAGAHTVRLLIPEVLQETAGEVVVELPTEKLSARVVVKPVRKMTLYVLNHSHTDIGYTDLQTVIEQKQVDNLLQGIAMARATASNPPGSRFVWNVEVGWATDLYQRRLNPAQRADYDEAVKKGWVAPQGLYLNMLTGLCRPEELIRTCTFATEEARRLGVKIDSAMISDVPGYTWGTVNALAQAGIRYFSVAPNYFDRIGDILVQWENKPFWWVSQSGRQRVLVWIPWRGYAMSHEIKGLDEALMARYQDQMDAVNFPYDISYMRWAGHGDNAVPEQQPTDFAKEWNHTYIWPKLVISSTSEAFAAFENRYGDKLPEVRGDWTPYWEDGAGSSAAETALNRASSERLTQAQALFAMRDPADYQPVAFSDAWNSTMLYSEHTWGAAGSITTPEAEQTVKQWAIKQGYALDADKRSRELLGRALGGDAAAEGAAMDIYNTCAWSRSDVVILPKEQSGAGDQVLDAAGQAVPSQRLSTGELCFLVRDIPGLSARRFTFAAGPAAQVGPVIITRDGLDNGLVRVRLDPQSGAIAELCGRGIAGNLAGHAAGHAPNDYLYLIGDKPADAKRNGPVTITVKENGPLLATLAVDSDAPGCRHLRRELRVIAGLDRVEITDIVDKERAPSPTGNRDYHQYGSKESVNIAFPFAVPNGQMWLDTPFAVVRPDHDLMPSACKNWFSVGRWVEIANAEFGVTWATVDAPLIQVGGITATLLNSQTNPAVWRKTVEPTQAFYVWAMNNHWGTNYRAYQEGPVSFRFALHPHCGNDLAAAARFGNGYGQPLLATHATGSAPPTAPRLRVSADDVMVTGFKPADDGKGWVVRLFGAGGTDRQVTLTWSDPQPASLWLSDTTEQRGTTVDGPIAVPAWGLVTIRAER
jgi:hypothetical protein